MYTLVYYIITCAGVLTRNDSPVPGVQHPPPILVGTYLYVSAFYFWVHMYS